MKKELICINCPMGCLLQADICEDGEITVTGNSCPRGKTYAISELRHPVRMLTSVVPVLGGDLPMLSCRTERPVAKESISAILQALRHVRAAAPVKIGDIVLENAAGSGVNIIATKNILKR